MLVKGKGDRQALTDALGGIQVLTPREDHAFAAPTEDTGHTVVEALFYIKFKRFPKDKAELAAFEKENPVPADRPVEWEEWRCKRLVIGTGVYGLLLVMKDVEREAKRRKVELIVLPAEGAIERLT